MSPRHRAILQTKRLTSGPWWVEWARFGAALLCAAVWATLATVVYLAWLR